MSLTQTEKQSLLELKSQGYSFEDSMGFIASTRLGKQSRVTRDLLQEQEQKKTGLLGTIGNVLRDIPEDISTGYRNMVDATTQGMETAQDVRGQVEKEEISPLAGTAKTIGAGLMAGAGVVGSAVGAIAKLPFTQKAEEGIADTVESGIEKVAQTQTAQDVVSKYESLTSEQKALVDGALGTTAGLATILGAGPAVKTATKAVETVSNVGKGVLRTGLQGIDDVATLFAKEGITGAGEIGIQQAAQKGPGFAEGLMQRVARVSKGKQAKFEDRAGESVGEYLVKRGIFGTPDQLVDQLYTRMQQSMSRLDRAVSSVKGNYRKPAIKNALDELVVRESKVGGVGRTSKDGLRIRELAKKHSNEGLTLSEINEVKRLYERNVKLDYVQDINPVGLERAKRIDTSLRLLVEEEAAKKGITIVRELNRETSLARQLADDLGAEYSGKAGNNIVGLTDWIILAQATNNPTAAAGFMAKKFFGSEKVMSATSQLLARNKAVLKELPVPGKAVNQPPISGYAAFLEKHADAFPQTVQKTTATR